MAVEFRTALISKCDLDEELLDLKEYVRNILNSLSDLGVKVGGAQKDLLATHRLVRRTQFIVDDIMEKHNKYYYPKSLSYYQTELKSYRQMEIKKEHEFDDIYNKHVSMVEYYNKYKAKLCKLKSRYVYQKCHKCKASRPKYYSLGPCPNCNSEMEIIIPLEEVD